jgi:hypothetical protein
MSACDLEHGRVAGLVSAVPTGPSAPLRTIADRKNRPPAHQSVGASRARVQRRLLGWGRGVQVLPQGLTAELGHGEPFAVGGFLGSLAHPGHDPESDLDRVVALGIKTGAPGLLAGGLAGLGGPSVGVALVPLRSGVMIAVP